MLQMEPQPAFTARQVAGITGIGQPVLTDLVRRGIVSPSTHRGSGTGDNNVFSVADLFGIRAVQLIRPKSETTEMLRALFAFWHGNDGLCVVMGPRPIEGVVVVDNEGGVSFQKETD